eukprot:gene14170-biopygen11709
MPSMAYATCRARGACARGMGMLGLLCAGAWRHGSIPTPMPHHESCSVRQCRSQRGSAQRGVGEAWMTGSNRGNGSRGIIGIEEEAEGKEGRVLGDQGEGGTGDQRRVGAACRP